jgi:hypothetical protein
MKAFVVLFALLACVSAELALPSRLVLNSEHGAEWNAVFSVTNPRGACRARVCLRAPRAAAAAALPRPPSALIQARCR